MNKPKLILASSSIYRRNILKKLGMEFSWAIPDINETPHPNEQPTQLVQRLAQQKAEKLAEAYPNHLIIGSDQVASIDGQILGKPMNHEAAISQLKHCSGREVTFITGLCLHNSHSGQVQLSADTYSVKFRSLTPEQIENYLCREQPYDCAGSFKSEGFGICLFEKMEGKDPNTLVGLPLIDLIDMLINEGIDPLMMSLNQSLPGQ